MNDPRTLHIKAEDGIYTSVSITDDDGKPVESVTSVKWSVDVGEVSRATVTLDWVPVDLTVPTPSYVIDAPDTQGVPLPEGLTVEQAKAVRDLFGHLALEYQRNLEEMKQRPSLHTPSTGSVARY